MSLRWQLARAHLAVIVLFLVLTLICAALIQPSPFPLHPRRRAAVENAVRQGEVFTQQQARRLGIPTDGKLWVLDARGFRLLYGEATDPPDLPEFGQQDTEVLRFSRSSDYALHAFPLDDSRYAVIEVPSLKSTVRRRIVGAWAAATLGAALACFLLSFLLSRRLARPITEVSEAAQKFGPDSLEVRAPVGGAEEVEALGRAFNAMAERLRAVLLELQQEKEKAEASEARKQQFLSDVSHNLRTPLAAVVGWADALDEGVVEEERRPFYYQKIRREAEVISRALERLLTLSRWSQHEPRVHRETVTVSETVLEVAELLEEQARDQNIELRLAIPRGAVVSADRTHLREILQILLENVVHHSGGNCQVEVALEAADAVTVITVTDTGVGVPAPLQLEKESVDKGGRISLGLVIAARLSKANGGLLEVVPNPQGGAVARLSLPGTESQESGGAKTV